MEIPAGARVCPHCRKGQGVRLNGKIVLAALLVSAAAFFILWKGTARNTVSLSQPPQSAQLEMLGWEWGKQYGHVIISGQVRNISEGSLEHVMVTVTFHDSKGAFITEDSSFLESDPLLPGQTSPFRVYTRHDPAMDRVDISFTASDGKAIVWRQ